METIFPNYDNCLTNVTNSILKYFDINPYHKTLKELDQKLNQKEYKNIVLILYDGMGSNLLNRNLDKNSFLNEHKIKDINSVFPSTTVASTTSVLSGLNPCEHGWLGWDLYFKNEEKIVTMFLNTIKDTNIVASDVNLANKYYPYKSIIELINEKYQAYKLMPFGETCYENLENMNERIIQLTKQEGKKFIYAYCDEPDHTMHDLGTNHEDVVDLFKTINNSTEKLCESLKDTLVIVIADHGHLNCESITLSNYPDIFNLLEKDISIESRACSFFIKENAQEEFRRLFHQYFSNDFKLYSKKEVIEKQLFGTGRLHKNFEDSLGDFLAIAISNKYFRYNEDSVKLTSMHAGITKDEVQVPLIVIEKEGGLYV